MTDKTKKTLLLVVGALVCVALIVSITTRFGGQPQTKDPVLNNDTPQTSDPVVDIDTPDDGKDPAVNVQINAGGKDDGTKPGEGADSTGTEQTIQGDPVKPQPPEPPAPIDDDHGADAVPESERNTETPPTYTPDQTTVTPPADPAPGSTNGNGQMYVPGFGYVDVGGGNEGGTLDDMYESGEKVGIMD